MKEAATREAELLARRCAIVEKLQKAGKDTTEAWWGYAPPEKTQAYEDQWQKKEKNKAKITLLEKECSETNSTMVTAKSALRRAKASARQLQAQLTAQENKIEKLRHAFSAAEVKQAEASTTLADAQDSCSKEEASLQEQLDSMYQQVMKDLGEAVEKHRSGFLNIQQ